MDFDTSWCPVCDRQILPKRYQVPVAPPPPPAPAPPPSSPQSSPTKTHSGNATTTRRTKGGTIRARAGGLVQGTGRVKPNGTLKRANSGSKNQSAAPPAPTKPTAPIKQRTVIDQGPIPLYCSDECQLADINNVNGTLPIGYNPNRESLPLPPVPHNSFRFAGSETESDSTDSSSLESRSSLSSPLSNAESAHMSPSIATLAAMYNFPPLPPLAPTYDEPSSSSDSEYPHEYTSGIMMAGRRIEAMCPKPAKRAPYGPNNYSNAPEPRKAIPGWTDGSNAWRSAVYSFSSPKDAVSDPSQKDQAPKAYKSFAASPHRSRGVYSTLGDASVPSSTAAPLPPARSAETEELISRYSQSFSRKSESRASLFTPSSPKSTRSFPATAPTSQRRERSLVEPGAEGKLLVPNVKMRVHGGSSGSLSSAWSGSSYPATTASSRRSVRSPLMRYGSEISDEDAQTQRCDSYTSLPALRRPTVETRSWSYDNLKTYPIMQLPSKKEKRLERQVVNGVEKDVEVEVEVVEPIKRLFLFADKETSRERR